MEISEDDIRNGSANGSLVHRQYTVNPLTPGNPVSLGRGKSHFPASTETE
jgi:hypothetical protein